MAITPRGSTMHATYTSGSNASPTWPAGIADQDVVYAVLNVGTGATNTIPSGWTQVDTFSFSAARGYIYRHVYAAGETSNSFVWSSSGNFGLAYYALGGVNTTTPEDGTPAHSAQAPTTTQTLPTVTTATAGALILYATTPVSSSNNTTSGTGITDVGDSAYVHLMTATPSTVGSQPGPTITYGTAYSGSQNVGAFAIPIKPAVASPDTTAPTVTSFTATAGNASNQLAWSATDNVGVTSYTLQRGGTTIYTGSATSFTDTGLTNGTAYSYTLTATDAAGNTSTASTASATPSAGDTTAPVISSFTASPSNASVVLNWVATDNVAVTGYVLSRGGTQIYSGTATSYSDSSLVNGTTYTYMLVASDAAGNTSTTASTTATPAASSGPVSQPGPSTATGAPSAVAGGRLVRSPDNSVWLPETPVNLPARRLTAWMHGPNVLSRCKHYPGGAAVTNLNSRRYHKALFTGQDLIFHYSNIRGVEDQSGLSAITVSAYLELGGGTTASSTLTSGIRITFGGQLTATIQPGGFVKSDPIPIRVLKGQVYYEQTYVTAAASPLPILNPNLDTANFEQSNSTATSDLTGTNWNTNSGVGVYGANAVSATPAGRVNVPMVVGIGDSRMEGVSRLPLFSWFDQVLELANIPHLKMSMSGETAIQFVGGTAGASGLGRRVRGRLISGATDLVSDYSINDLNTGADGPTMIGRFLLAGRIAQYYGARFHQTTIEPFTTSTDSWQTADNQTPNTNTEPARLIANAWLRDGAPYNPATGNYQPVGTATSATCIRIGAYGHPITGVIDIAAPVEVTNTAGQRVWNINAFTSDGLHAGGSGHNMQAVTFAAYAATHFAAYAA